MMSIPTVHPTGNMLHSTVDASNRTNEDMISDLNIIAPAVVGSSTIENEQDCAPATISHGSIAISKPGASTTTDTSNTLSDNRVLGKDVVEVATHPNSPLSSSNVAIAVDHQGGVQVESSEPSVPVSTESDHRNAQGIAIGDTNTNVTNTTSNNNDASVSDALSSYVTANNSRSGSVSAVRSPTPQVMKPTPYTESAEDAAKFEKSCENLTRRLKPESKILNTEVRTILSWHFERLVVCKEWKAVKEFLSMWKDRMLQVNEIHLLIAHIGFTLGTKDDITARANLIDTLESLETLYKTALNAKIPPKVYERVMRGVKLQKIVQMRIDAVTAHGDRYSQLLETAREAINEYFPADDELAQSTRKCALAICEEDSSAFDDYLGERAETDLQVSIDQAMELVDIVLASLGPTHLHKISNKFQEYRDANKRTADRGTSRTAEATGQSNKRAKRDEVPTIDLS